MVVPDDQLSLAIGKEGQNARLAAKLTGYKIDIKAESAAHEWDEEDAAAVLQRANEEIANATAAAASMESAILAAFGMSSYEEAMQALAEDEAEEAAAAAAAEAEAAEDAEASNEE